LPRLTEIADAVVTRVGERVDDGVHMKPDGVTVGMTVAVEVEVVVKNVVTFVAAWGVEGKKSFHPGIAVGNVAFSCLSVGVTILVLVAVYAADGDVIPTPPQLGNVVETVDGRHNATLVAVVVEMAAHVVVAAVATTLLPVPVIAVEVVVK
jgi:hypothetical protein